MGANDSLVRTMSEALLGRRDIEDEFIAETAERLSGLLDQLREIDESLLQDLVPAATYMPANDHYALRPTLDSAEQQTLDHAGRAGTGYGGSRGLTGTAGLEEARALNNDAPPRASTVPPDELTRLGIVETARRIRRRQLSPVEVTRAALAQIEALDSSIRAFVSVTGEQALEAATRAEADLGSGRPLGPLHGVPVALKDLYETAGVRTTAGSRLLADYVPSSDATAVQLLRQAGAIIVGKTATHEFAFGTTTDSPFHGPVHNPWNQDHIPGGSSGGSAAAVSARMVPCALGTDTGGSIRIPAAACGTVGLKPTYGRVSKAGIIPLSWSLDHAGPLTANVQDAAVVLGVLSGADPRDPAASHAPVEDYLAAAQNGVRLHGINVGVPAGWLDDRIDPGVRNAFEESLEVLSGLGAKIRRGLYFPAAPLMTLVNRLIALGEAASYHAPTLQGQSESYGEDVRARLEVGQLLLARDYLLGQRLRTLLVQRVNQVMHSVDVLATPTIPFPAPKIGQRTWTWANGETETVPEGLIRLTAPFDVTGQPAVAVPCGLSEGGLPISLQLVGRHFEEASLLRIARAYEQAAAGRGVPRWPGA